MATISITDDNLAEHLKAKSLERIGEGALAKADLENFTLQTAPIRIQSVAAIVSGKPANTDELRKLMHDNCHIMTMQGVGQVVKQLELPSDLIVFEGDVRFATDPDKVVCVVGDITIRGNLALANPLLVVGSLTIEGSLANRGPEGQLAVTGNLSAKHIDTSGGVIVAGDCLAGVIYASYNDDSFEVLGALEVEMVISDEHACYFSREKAKIGHRGKYTVWNARDAEDMAKLHALLPEGVSEYSEDYGRHQIDREKLLAQ